MPETKSPEPRHFTLSWGFAVAVGLLVVSLYFVWAFFGAAPTTLGFFSAESDVGITPMSLKNVEIESVETEGMSTAGHGSGSGTMTPDEFTVMTEKFVEDLALEDGSVLPTRAWTVAMNANAASGEQSADATDNDDPIDIYIMALRFSYEPSVLRLEKDTPYRFRMMSMDVNHGASINTGLAGHIMRRPAMVLTEMVMSFSEPGDYMIYCTVYCGIGHDQMKGKIIVE